LVEQLFIAIFLGIVGSYISFFNPKLFSINIIELNSSIHKWITSFVSVVVIILLLVQTDLKTNLDYLSYSFITVFYFIAAIDLYSKIIPNRLVLLLLIISVAKLTLNFDLNLVIAAGAIIVLLIVVNLSINKFFKKVLFGWGDVKLIGVLGLFIGWEVFWVFYIAIILGGLLSIFGIVFKKISISSKIPIAIFKFIGYQIVSLELIHLDFISNLM
jgi:Flp pilus assembly protein protease CpaA